MLKFDFKICKAKGKVQEIECSSLFLSDDLTYISGITSPSYRLVNGQTIYLSESNSKSYHKYPIQIFECEERGYVLYRQKYSIHEYEYMGENYKGFMFADGKTYIANEDDKLSVSLIEKSLNWSSTNGDTDLVLSGNSNEIELYTKYPIYNSIVTINGIDYEVDFDYDNPEIPIVQDGENIKVQDSDKINNVVKFFIRKGFDYKLSVDDISLATKDEELGWVDTDDGEYVHLYLDDGKYSFKPSDIIKITNRSIESKTFKVVDGFITLYGIKYYVNDTPKQFVKFGNNEYELLEEKEVKYIVVDNEVVTFTSYDETNKEVSTIEGNNYKVLSYNYITINGDDYIVNNDGTVTYNMLHPIKLLVYQVKGTNQLLCTFLNADGDDEKIKKELEDIVFNYENYTFELERKLFEEGNINNAPSYIKDYVNIEYKLFKSIENINLRLNLNNDYDAKLHQELVQENDFFGVEKRNSINEIIDMEKDIYYPARKDGGSFINVDKIVIDLHFRSRDYDSWTINDTLHGSTSDSDKARCNWNIIDYYGDGNDTRPKIDFSDYPYYQPSDLLWFLKFTDDDIFYQKDKVGKSFLRLSFYDSPNVRKQSLLATSTIFIDEGELYKKFINNRVNKGNFVLVNNDGEKNVTIEKNISVMSEPIEKINDDKADINNLELTFNEEERLSSSLTIKNMYESNESSEGFYLYLFKNYSSGLTERTIYLKVEFNHAGVGRKLTFTQPHKDDGGEKSMLILSEDIDILKNGCTLQNMSDWIYLPINLKYDKTAKRYYYYLPDWLTEHNDEMATMRLNLYELKISN